MYIWQDRTTLGSTTWGSFSDIGVFATANGGFSVGTVAKLEGSGATEYTMLFGDISFLGTPTADLAAFTANVLGTTVPVTIISAPDFPNSRAFYGETFAIQRLDNGHWVAAYLSDDPLSPAAYNYRINLVEFDENHTAIANMNVRDDGLLAAYFDFSTYENSRYQFTYSGVFVGGTNDGFFGERIFKATVISATSAASGGLPATASVVAPSAGYNGTETATGTMNASGQSRIFWLDNTTTYSSVMSRFIDATGTALTAPETIWQRNGTSVPETHLEATSSLSTSYIAWSVAADATTGATSQMFLAICPNIGTHTLLPIETLPGFSPNDNRVYDIEILKNGTLALLSRSGTQFHVSILSSAGALLDDLAWQIIDSANTMWLTTGANLSLTELTDGRLVVAGETVTSLNLASLNNQQAHDQNDLSYLIIDPRGQNIFGTAGNDNITGRLNQFEIIRAGAGNDTVFTMSGAGVVYGEAGNDEIFGSAGGDVLSGGADNDVIAGDAGNDELNGDGGNDQLLGGADNDYLYGGEGNDILSGGTETDFLRGGAGDDQIYGGDATDLLFGDAGADVLDGGNGQDTVSYVESSAGVNIYFQNLAANLGDAAGDSYSSIERFVLSNFDDLFDANNVAGLIDVQGKGGNDTIYGRTSGLQMYGGDGNDLFFLRGGNNVVQGDESGGSQGLDIIVLLDSVRGIGLDMAAATTRDATFKFLFLGQTQTIKGDVDGVFGSFFGDDLNGNSFDNVFYGSLGNDRLVGRGGNDTLYGEDSSDFLFGDEGDDDLSGGANNDVLDGGTGADKLKGDENDAGGDTVTYQNSFGAVSVDLNTGLGSGGDAAGDTLTGIENLIGSAQGDQLIGDSGRNTLRGGAGNDVLGGSFGADVLIGGADVDTAVYNNAPGINVSLRTGIASDGDTLSEIENITGSSMGDVLEGDAGANTIRGAAGNDLLIAGNGADLLIGGADNDTVSYETATTGIAANLTTGIGANGGVLSEIENLTGSNFGDVLYGSNIGNTIKGGAGNDFIVGGAGSDALYGGADADIFRYEAAGYGGDVIVDFQDGIDKLSFATTLATSFSAFTVAGNGTTSVTLTLAGQAIVVQGAANITLDAGDFLFV